jgi:hypothetical protein
MRYKHIRKASLFVVLILAGFFFFSCIEQEKAVRLGELHSLSHLREMVSAQPVRIQDPDYGYVNVYLAARESSVLTGRESVFDIVVKGELSQSKKIWIQNYAVNDFSLLLLKGSTFKVKRSVKSQTPIVTIAMASEGHTSGLRSDVLAIPKPPYTVARLQFSDSALPNFSLLSYGTNFYVRGTYEAHLGEAKDTAKAEQRIPITQILKLLFDIEYPAGNPGLLSGKLYLLHYEVTQVQPQRILIDCLFFVSVE